MVALDVVGTALDRQVERRHRGSVLTEPGEQLAAHCRQPVAPGQLVVEPVEGDETSARPITLGERHGRREPDRR